MFNRSLTIARVAAIPIRLHWSWLVIFALLAASLRPLYALLVCEGAGPCGPDLALAALMAALVGASVLLHELGHALVARRLLVPVQSITLFAFGGVAEVESEAPTPEAEFAIAVAGPAVSLLVALGAGLLWWARARTGDALAHLAAHLAVANTIMALFNLLPGYPMDGGRVLRATLWFLGDEMLPATRVAAQAGRLCGWALGLGGLALAVAAREPLAALWAGLVGFFLYRTASSSYRGLRLQFALQGTTVGDLMQRRLRTVTPDLSLEQFVAHYVLGQAETGFPVVEPAGDDEHLVGMMTLRNLRRFTTAQWSGLRVAEAMTPASQVPTLAPETPVFDALYALRDNADGLVPVVAGGRLVGLLRRRDVALFVQVQLARQQR